MKEELWFSDPRTVAAAGSFIVAVVALFLSYFQTQRGVERHEERDHFDADVRDVVYEYLAKLRDDRDKICKINYGKVSALKKFDYARHVEVLPNLFHIAMMIRDAVERYDKITSIKRYVHQYEEPRFMRLGEIIVEEIAEKEDAIQVVLSEIRETMVAGSGSGNIEQHLIEQHLADLRIVMFEYGRSVRDGLNEMRARISTKRGLRYWAWRR